MNSKYFLSSPNSVDYSSPNPVNYSYLAHTHSEEHHRWSISNTNLPMSNIGVDISMSNSGQAGGSNAGQAGGSNASHLSGPKPRGRPRGAKNKPNKDVINMASQVKTAVLEIPPGFEVVEWLKQFAQSRNCFVNVLSGFGRISQVAYSHLSSQHPIILSEKLTLVSFTGIAGLITPSETGCSFTAVLARLNGTVIGGMLFKLVAMEPVVLTVLISQKTEVVAAGLTIA